MLLCSHLKLNPSQIFHSDWLAHTCDLVALWISACRRNFYSRCFSWTICPFCFRFSWLEILGAFHRCPAGGLVQDWRRQIYFCLSLIHWGRFHLLIEQLRHCGYIRRKMGAWELGLPLFFSMGQKSAFSSSNQWPAHRRLVSAGSVVSARILEKWSPSSTLICSRQATVPTLDFLKRHMFYKSSLFRYFLGKVVWACSIRPSWLRRQKYQLVSYIKSIWAKSQALDTISYSHNQ